MTDKIEEQNSNTTSPSLPDDTEKEHPAPKSPPTKNKASTTPKKRSSAGLIFFTLIISFIAIGTSGWLFYQTYLTPKAGINLAVLTSQQTQLSNDLLKQQQALKQLQSTITQQQTQVTNDILTKLEQLTQTNRNNSTRFDFDLQVVQEKLKRLENTTKEDWKLAEAEYLIRLANQRLLMDKDVLGAEKMLRNADDILEQLDDPLLFNVRRTLAQDIQQLATTPNLDLQGTYLQLEALNSQIKLLPQKGHQRRISQQPNTLDKLNTTQAPTVEKSILDELWSTLKTLVIINHHDKPIKPLLPPVAYQQLITNVQLQLNVAQLALLKQETTIYQTALQHVSQIVTDHFDTNSNVVQHFLSITTELKQQQINPTLPLPRDSLLAIKETAKVWHGNSNAKAVIQSTEETQQ